MRLNQHHTVGQLRQQVAAQTGDGRRFVLVTAGGAARTLDDDRVTLKEADLLGAAVLLRYT